MKITFALIKQIISIISTSTSLGTFIITTLCTKTKSPKFIEYTDLSKFFLNLYIFLLLLLCCCHSIYPKLICNIFTDRLGIITTDRGKIVILTAIFVMYFSTESLTQKLFGMISFVSTLGLFLSDLVLNCDTLNQKPLTNKQIGINIKQGGKPVINTNVENVAKVINVPDENKK